MEDRGGKNGRRMAVADTFDHVIEIADATRGDHRHMHGIRNGAGEANIVARLLPVAVHGGQEQLTAPRSTILMANSTASMPVALRPPWVKISQRSVSPGLETFFESMDTTMH